MRCAVASSNTHRATAGAQSIPSIGSAIFRARRVIGLRSLNKNESAQPSRQMRRILASKLPTTAPSKSETSSTKTHPPNVDAWRFGSLRAYQRVPSLKSTDWAGPYVNGRSHTWPTSAQPQPATHRTEALNGIIELNRRIARGYRNHQLSTPNAPHRRRPRRLHPHPTLKSRFSRSVRWNPL